MAGRDVRRPGIDELPVYLVRKQVQVIFLHQVADLVHLAARVQIPGRIVRIANEYGFRFLVYQRFEILNIRQRISVAYIGFDGFYLHTGLHGKRYIVGICRLGYNNVVTRIDTRRECQLQSFRASSRDNYVLRRDVDTELCIISYQLVAVRR